METTQVHWRWSWLAVLAAGAVAAGADSGSWMKFNGETYPIRYQYAVPAPNTLPSELASGTFDVDLILVDAPLPKRFLDRPLWDRHIRTEPNIHGVLIELNAKRQFTFGALLVGSDDAPADLKPTNFSVTAVDAQHVMGAVTRSELRLPNQTGAIAFQIKIDAPFWKTPPPAPVTAEETKAAQSAPQTKVFQAYLAAVKAGNVTAWIDTLSADSRKQMPATAGERAQAIQMMQEFMPKGIRVLRVTVSGSTAELEAVDGSMKAWGTVEFRLEGTQWKIAKMEWDDTPGAR